MSELDPKRWRILAVVATAFFMTILDVSIVNVALPSISRALHFSRENLQWVITAYSIAFGGFLLLAGRAADLLGRRRVFMVGVTLFSIASLVCGLASAVGVLAGGVLTKYLGWEWIFFVNVPVGAVVLALTPRIVPESKREGAERS